MTILDYIHKNAGLYPARLAIIHDSEQITYAQLYERMRLLQPLPIPLLGDAWDKSFRLHTTGTTGKSKTIVISQDAVIANSENLIDAQGFSHETVFVVAGAVTHLGSWSKLFPVLMLGGTLIILDDMKDINAFYKALDYPSSHLASFLVPANIRILLQFSADRLASYADRIEFLETGGAPIAHADMLRLCEILPHTRLFNTYASTEAGIVATYNYNDGRTISGCCGRPLKHSRVFITDDGKIACQGDTLMTCYENDPELTASVLRDGTLFTADNGEFDAEGMLHVLGRSDDVINIGGYKVAPNEVEDSALTMPEIKDCICIPCHHPVLGTVLKLLVVLIDGAVFDKKRIARHINSQLERYKVPSQYEQVPFIHRTFNGKLDRKYYL